MSADRDALAREIVERRTGMPAYLAPDEDWDAAVAEANDADLTPEPEPTGLAAAVQRARGQAPGQIEESIGFLNRAAAALREARRAR